MKKYTRLLNEKTGQCVATDKKIQGFKLLDVTLSPFDNCWYITSYLDDNEEYQRKLFALRKKDKYTEITEKYDTCCKYGICPATISQNGKQKEYFCNRAWLGTWSEAITGLEYTGQTAFVRLYEKFGDFHYKNITLENITLEQYKDFYLQLINFRFNTLQVKRNAFLAELENCKTAKEVESLDIDFGVDYIDEQNDIDGKIILAEPRV